MDYIATSIYILSCELGSLLTFGTLIMYFVINSRRRSGRIVTVCYYLFVTRAVEFFGSGLPAPTPATPDENHAGAEWMLC